MIARSPCGNSQRIISIKDNSNLQHILPVFLRAVEESDKAPVLDHYLS